MRKTYRVLGYLLALEVVIQAMAMAYGTSGLSHWVLEEDGVLNKQVRESDDIPFTEVVGFIVHGMNGMMLIPLLALILLIVSFFAKVPGGTKWAGILFGLVVVQVLLGINASGLPFLGLLHGLNAFAIFATAVVAARAASAVPVASSVGTRADASV
ncbi:MAG TPA: DUF6220 domain-containing protein [Mycobacteriales bacterium]|nr:DUF6220 domain-containing protein [Mycobacteriales bacterium]